MVLGGDYQGLAIVRSLGRRGVPVCVVDDERSIARFSRYTASTVRARDLSSVDGTIAALRELPARVAGRGWLLFPTRDEQVEAIARHRTEMLARFRVSTPGWDVARWMCDKRNTYRLAEDLGIPVPRTWRPRSPADLRRIEVDGPLVIKPAKKGAFLQATKAKAWRADDARQLEQRFRAAVELTGDDEILIQELIPGDGRRQFAYCAFYKERRAVATMVARRRRQHPPQFGRASTLAETVEHPLVEELSERFLRHLDYYGLVELEYKADPRDGRPKLLDVNARTWGYHSLGRAAGVDFPALLFDDQVGAAVPSVRARAGVRWVRLATDTPTAVLQMLGGELAVGDYVRSLRGVSEESVMSLHDPLPALAELFYIPYLAAKRGF